MPCDTPQCSPPPCGPATLCSTHYHHPTMLLGTHRPVTAPWCAMKLCDTTSAFLQHSKTLPPAAPWCSLMLPALPISQHTCHPVKLHNTTPWCSTKFPAPQCSPPSNAPWCSLPAAHCCCSTVPSLAPPPPPCLLWFPVAVIRACGIEGRNREAVNGPHGDWLSGRSGCYAYGPGLLLYRIISYRIK